MTMKQLFRHTSTLLRTALLLGALAFVNMQSQAQSLVDNMPDAFETRDVIARPEMIGNGLYYYIQFFDGDESGMNRSYLSDQGAGYVLRSKDYLPFAKNIQWRLVSTGTANQFYLQSALGNYVKMENGKYLSTTDFGEATPLTAYKADDGSHYEISTAENTANAMYRDRGRVWTEIIDASHNYDHKDHNMSRCFLRFAKLKDNIAHIIYYQDPIYNNQGNVADANGEYRGGAEGFGKRHYLTYSGTGAQSETSNWTSVITNGDMSGDDATSFRTGAAASQPATIKDGAGRMGGRGVEIVSAEGQSNIWSTQLFVCANTVIGTKNVHIEFDYKANRAVDGIRAQAQNGPGNWISAPITGLNFKTYWQHYSGDFQINNDGFNTIAFDLGMTGTDAADAATFYFDNIVFSTRPDAYRAGDISSRSSVMDTYDSWSFTTAAKYHEDGLWVLEKGNDTETGAEFYIKKYGTSDYLNPEQGTENVDPAPALFYCVLGAQNTSLGRYVLEQPNNNRFTRVKNNTGGWYYTRYLSYSEGDGWPAMQLNDANTNPNFWNAGFLPVEVPTQDDFYRVLLGVKRDRKIKRTDHRIKLTGATKNPTIVPADGSTLTDLYGATFTPTADLTNVFQIKNLQAGCYEKIVIKFGSPVPAGWHIHAYGPQDNYFSLEGKTEYEIDLTQGPSVDDFTIFNWFDIRTPITITECYFYPEGPEPDCTLVPNEMLNDDGTTTSYSTAPASRKLWELEQVDDYGHFRLKAPDGRYFQDLGQMTDDPTNAAVFTNEMLLEYFDVKWYMINPAIANQKEIDMTDRMITHKMSYLKEYADDYPDLELSEQGLASDKDSDWWNFDKRIQKTNHFEITHFVKQGATIKVEFPTVLDKANDHVYYQRFYNYDVADEDMDLAKLNDLKAHIDLDTEESCTRSANWTTTTKDGVRYYLYKNGIVTGDRLYWEPESSTTSLWHNANSNFNFTNSDGKNFTVAVDVSRYSDLKYENEELPLDDNLEEPSLTMRYIYYMNDAKEMATKLTNFTEESTISDKTAWKEEGTVCIDDAKWYEKKTFHFPSKQVAYDNNKWEGYRGEFIGLRHVFSDYWVFNGGTGNDNLVSAVNDGNASGKIEVKIYDPNGTGIRLGGYNPNIGPRGTTANPIAGDIIRVYYKDKVTGGDNNFNPRFKYGTNDWADRGDWPDFQNNYTDHGSYFEVPITSDALAELTANGLRLQGRGFTLVKVVCIPQDGNGDRYPLIIFDQETRFDGWSVNRRIEPGRIKVGVNNEGNDGDYQGFYFYDKMNTGYGAYPDGKTQYGDSRFIVFRYPKGTDGKSTEVTQTGKEVYIHVYFNDGGTRYQLAQFTVIFDKDCDTRPWTSVNGSAQVKGTKRDPNKLREVAGKPIAKITFDYPKGDTYHYPPSGTTLHHQIVRDPGGTIANSSPLPLTFDHTNYSFDGDECNWAAYAMVSQKRTEWGNNIQTLPADHATAGYNIPADAGMQQGFLYIDASEQPGDICAADFQGEFCEDDKLMCSGWISGSNRYTDNGSFRCPGGITLTVKGEPLNGGETETIYRFCPGQCYELDNGSGVDGSNGATQVVWQQFYFEFSTDKKYKRYWMEVNNNCVSSNGGDFMLDNVEVYAIVPEVIPDINTPLCVSLDEDGKTVSDMRLLKIEINYNKLKSSRTVITDASDPNYGTAEEGFVFLEKNKFLETFRTQLVTAMTKLTAAQKHSLGLDGFNFSTIKLEELAAAIEEGMLSHITQNDYTYQAYKDAFDSAILGEKSTWHSDNPTVNMKASIMYFRWNSNYDAMEEFSFAKAVNKKGSVFRQEIDGEKFVVMNGNYPGLKWKTNTDYYVINTANTFASMDPFSAFNLCSQCCKSSTFRIEPPLEILGLDKSQDTNEYLVCQGQIPTLLTNLKGYDLTGKEVPMKDLNYDWWLGDKANGVIATLDNYHSQKNKAGTVRLDKALSTLRIYYPEINSLDGIISHLAVNPNPELTSEMVAYLKELVDAGQLILHQKSISIPAEPVAADDPYFYLVACPIHDDVFNRALNPAANQYVAFFCDEPQGLRVRIGDKAPTLKCGFVPGENGFDTYNYDFPPGTDPVLSIRLAKAAQFETVRNKNPEADGGAISERSDDLHYLWLPIRNARTQYAEGVVQKAQDDYIYLASTNDPTWDKEISKSMNLAVPTLPVVGRIVELKAVNIGDDPDKSQISNRLCVYFTENFKVREGYNYTLSLPFQEILDENGSASNACDGTILINLKIVPDYEVWTGGADNTDWNNDQNWRRADGNTNATQQANTNERNADELYVASAVSPADDPLEIGSPLYGYTTNRDNYRTSKDRIFRKGFAPLYCTHVLLKSDEWGDAPVLYDALDGKGNLTATPFPNLRDKDGWDGTVTDEDAGTTATKATATSILRFDMQARLWDIWEDTYGFKLTYSDNKGREGDLLAEMYQINSCDEIAFQPGTELQNAHLLNYNSAWVEYQLDNKRWYLLGSPLQGTIAGEWYAPTGNAKQQTTYYDPVKFGPGYDRYSPAIYQRSWDKAKSVLYEVGSEYSTSDNPDDLALTEGRLPGSTQQGYWDNSGQTVVWNTTGADEYLDRLGYKPMGDKKVNVAMKGIWSNTYNDATVDYTKGGFSVMVMNHLKGSDGSGGKSIIRLPKEDQLYQYYEFSETGAADHSDEDRTDTNLGDVRADLSRNLNRGRLKTDLLLPETTQKEEQETNDGKILLRYSDNYGDRTVTRVPILENDLKNMTLRSFTETVSAGVSNMGFYLVENPFPCGLNMDKFFAANTDLEEKYWLLTATGQHLVQKAAGGEWISPTISTSDGDVFAAANRVTAPGQGFFVQAKTAGEGTTITFKKDMQAQSRFGKKTGESTYPVEVGQTQKMKEHKEMVDDDNNPETPDVEQTVYIDVDLNGNGIYGETITIDGQTVVEREPVMEPVYIEDPENSGTMIPDLVPIIENVTVSRYVQSTDEGEVFPLKARTRGEEAEGVDLPGLVITAKRGETQSSALVMQHEKASNDFLPSEDTEVFITSDLESVPTVFTLCGRLATTINSIHDFRSLPLGVESNSEAPCTLTFKGVELLGDSISFYDAVEQKLTPLTSGTTVSVSGQTQNRYYIVRSLIQEEAAAETHLQIFTEGLTAKVIASTAEPITSVRCYDTAGRLIHSATPQTSEYSFTLPTAGIYIINAETENDRKTVKLMAK